MTNRQLGRVDGFAMLEVPSSGCPPLSFLSGRWRGDAIRLEGAKDHPTATAERAQDLCGATQSGEGNCTGPVLHFQSGKDTCEIFSEIISRECH